MSRLIQINLLLTLQFSIATVVAEDFSIKTALISPLAVHSIILDSDQSNGLVVMVGERGHIIYSQDYNNWNQALVETQVTLTGVYLLNETIGWAVGHDAVILKTTDGAKTWKKVFSAIDEQAPLLDIYFQDQFSGIAVGAYGLIYKTHDGGLSWRHSLLELSNIESGDSDDAPEFTEVYDLHFNAIAATQLDNKVLRYYLAVEAGHILRSDNGGDTWIDIVSPYHGSFFGVLPLSYDEVLVYGLRGHLFRSSDAGKTWEQIETGSEEMLTNATRLSDGRIILTGLAGTLLISEDEGYSFSKIELTERYGISSVLETDEGSLLLSTDSGIKKVSKDSFSTAVH